MSALLTNDTLADTFHKYFDVGIATQPEQRKAVYSVRYRVYCDEFGFESVEDFPDQLESDEYDMQATHCLVTHRASGKAAGCIRIIPAIEMVPLPFEKYCSHSLDADFIASLSMPRDTMCEISRLAVDRDFRKRSGEGKNRCGVVATAPASSEEEMRIFPLVAVATFLAATALTNLTGRNNVFMMTEAFLPKLLSRSGIQLQKAGREVDYHGLRAPYYIAAEDAARNLKSELRELYHSIYEQFARQAAPFIEPRTAIERNERFAADG